METEEFWNIGTADTYKKERVQIVNIIEKNVSSVGTLETKRYLTDI